MRFLADENFDNHIVRGLLRENPDIDLIRVQDTEVWQADDPAVLAWAAGAGRILLTHDIRTMPDYAYERVEAALPMPGVIVIRRQVSIGRAVAELLIVAGASNVDEWANQVNYLP